MSLSTPQIEAQLERVLASDPAAAVLAVRAQVPQLWPAAIVKRGRQFALRWCSTSLAIREALCEVEQLDPGTAGLVVLTPLRTHEIAEDIAARLARARVFEPEGWDIVRQMFQAKDTDARLGRFPWMPQYLIDAALQGPYAPVVNGFLGLETAWQEVMLRLLGISAARPDAMSLLTWSQQPGATVALGALAADARTDVLQWLGQAAGVTGNMILGCLEAGRLADALPLGLVCAVVFAAEGEGEALLGQAAIRLERFVHDRHIGVAEGRAWADAAEQVVRAGGLETWRGALDRADELLRDLRVGEFAHLSDLLPAALDQRLKAFAEGLVAHVTAPTASGLARVELEADRTLRHALLVEQAARAERVLMARRLARWLVAPTGAPKVGSFRAAVDWQVDEGAFLDWARFRLLGGDEVPELSQAYAACRDVVTARRNAFARDFAGAMIEWNAAKPARDGRLVPVECILDVVLAPVAASTPVLLLVMDGLSVSIFRELFARMGNHGWMEMVPADQGRPLAGVAVLPTVTETSRASLLCGKLVLGAAPQEKSGFAAHPGLLAHSRAGLPPRLFHKGDLADATNLSSEVRSCIGNRSQTVVGVVYNAVDDHLSGPDQLHQRWTLEDLRLLLPLLRAARDARRAVVVTADHGHVLEEATRQVPNGADSDRWRPGADALGPHELVVAGGRVVTGDGSNSVVCLWGESARYGTRKNGYHGGLSPQEVTVPLAVMMPSGTELQGWVPAPPAQPDWWDVATPQALPSLPETSNQKTAVSARVASRRQSERAGQTELFEQGAEPVTATGTGQDWIAALLAAPVYTAQRQLAARVALADDKMRALLTALADRGGKLGRAALAQRLAVPEMRLGGMLSAARRVLNVDQSAVLVVDDAAGTVELNIALLRQQFRVAAPGGPA
jgi:hypothetical protein